jgi:hypothetical protein
MNRMLVLVVSACVLACSAPALAQSAQRTSPDKDLQAALTARQHAVDTGDAAEWAKYTTDDYVQMMDNGRLRSKAERVKEMTKPTTPARPPVIDSIRMYGTDTAIVLQHNPTNTGRVLMVWVKQAGSWKCASAGNAQIAR